MGFSFRGAKDAALALFSILSAFSAVLLWRRGLYRKWRVFYALCVLMLFLQTFLFLYKQRFRVVLFDLPALLIIVLAIKALLDQRTVSRRTADSVEIVN